jgi:hypothetical protein
MKLRLAFVVTVLILIPSGYSEQRITFCELLKDPEKYSDKEVTVRATWRYGFEWSQFYCIDCSPKEMTWLEISPELDEASNRVLRQVPKGAGIVNITVQGTYKSGGHYGHMNAYPNQFTARRLSQVAIVSKGMKGLAEEQQAERRWACGGSNPK